MEKGEIWWKATEGQDFMAVVADMCDVWEVREAISMMVVILGFCGLQLVQ